VSTAAGPTAGARLSAVVLTYNEAREIGGCLDSLEFCDERIVIDAGSTDGTVALAEAAGARVCHQRFTNFADARNRGLSEATGDWVLYLDADERVSDALRQEILTRVAMPSPCVGYWFRRRDNFCGVWLDHGEVPRVRLMRLARRGAGDWTRRVHERWNIAGATGSIDNPILHWPHRSVEEFIRKINLYSTMDAQEHFHNGVRTGPVDVLAYPTAKFIQNYLLRGGFMDGAAGLIFACLMSVNSLLIRSKLLLLWRGVSGADEVDASRAAPEELVDG
jgi:glycosyltransferase involved in cell wall biosynthesis